MRRSARNVVRGIKAARGIGSELDCMLERRNISMTSFSGGVGELQWPTLRT